MIEQTVDDERCSECHEITYEVDLPDQEQAEISNEPTSIDAHLNAVRRLTVALSSSLPFIPAGDEDPPTVAEEYTIIFEFIKQVAAMDSVQNCS